MFLSLGNIRKHLAKAWVTVKEFPLSLGSSHGQVERMSFSLGNMNKHAIEPVQAAISSARVFRRPTASVRASKVID